MTRPIEGILSAFITPFSDDERLDRAALSRLVEFEIGLGIDGLYVGGSSGEAMLQSVEERADVLRWTAEAVEGRTKLVAHVGAVATRDVINLAEVAAHAGYHAISAVAPFYYPFTRAEIMAHYLAAAEASPLPLIIYNFPDRVGNGFSVPEFRELFSHPKIIGMKHTSMNFYVLERLKVHAPEAVIFNGYDEACVAGLAMGADGAIGTTYNFMGDLFVAIRGLVSEGKLGEARGLQTIANGLIEALIEVGVLPGSKSVLRLMGVETGPCRRPLAALDAADEDSLRIAVKPLLEWREERRDVSLSSLPQ